MLSPQPQWGYVWQTQCRFMEGWINLCPIRQISFLLGVPFDLTLPPDVWFLGSWPWRTSGFHCWGGGFLALPPLLPHISPNLEKRPSSCLACGWNLPGLELEHTDFREHTPLIGSLLLLGCWGSGGVLSTELNPTPCTYFTFWFCFLLVTRSLWCQPIGRPSCRFIKEIW